MKNKKAYIIYEYNDFTKDFKYIKEYYNIKELQEKENILLKNKKAIYQFIFSNIEEVKHLLKDKYIIIKEELWKKLFFYCLKVIFKMFCLI